MFPQDELFWRLVHYCREVYHRKRSVGYDGDFALAAFGLLIGYKRGWQDNDESWREEQGLPSGRVK